MREKSKSIPHRLKTVFFFAITLLALATVTPALADYLGPDRTVTQSGGSCKVVLYRCSFLPNKNIYKYKSGSNWSCSNESKPWLSYPTSGPSCNKDHVGASYWRKVDDSGEETITYPPATIQGLLQNCGLNNGWCRTFPQFSLIAEEPLPNYDITAIEGTWNGQNFACPDSECSVPLIEGQNDLTYWALSSWGDSSTMGSMSVKVDSQLPVISGAFSGTTGSNGWYVGSVSFAGSAADDTSGLASFTCTLDGAALGSCTSINVNDEGPHTLVLTALDNAGNSSVVVQDTSIDSRPPMLSSSLQGSLGSNGWYNAAELHVSATDPIPGSGVFALQYNIDGTSWMDFPLSGVLSLPDGQHSVDVHATDLAGHSVSSSKSYSLDSVAPNVILDPQGTLGANGWYITNLNLSASVSDGTSGVDLFEYTRNGSTWAAYTSSLVLTDGSHTVSFWAQDKAGLVTQVDRLYQVDTVRPQIAGTLAGTPGTNGWYTSNVILSASAADPLPGSGVDAFTYILNGGAETPYASALTLQDGVHTVRLNVQDKAGHTYFTEQSIKVDTVQPSLSIQTTLPAWVNGKVTLNGSSEDSGSGLSKVEISTNGGQSWRMATGTTSWVYEWDTSKDSNGSHTVIVRAIDQAGLASQQAIAVSVDNQAPNIQLRSKWLSWQVAILDIWDTDSGISEARIEFLDPEKRWPRRLIQVTSEKFPMHFKWDRRFGDDTIAPNGDYVVLVTAVDQLGNVAQQYSVVSVVIDVLPAGPTSTPQPYYRLDPTPIIASTPVPALPTVAASTPVVSAFGEIQPATESTPTPETSLLARATPTQTGIVEWLESILIPRTDLTDQTTELETLTEQPAPTSVPGTTSDILWGAAAAAMVGSVTSFALEEKRKREAAIAAQRAEELGLKQQKSRRKARTMEKLEQKWAQEEEWERARQENFGFIGTTVKVDRAEQKAVIDQIEAKKQAAEEKKRAEEKKKQEERQAQLEAFYARQQQQATAKPETESNWWEKTKSFVQNNILDPWDQYVYEPIVKPAVEKRNEILKNTVSWLNTNVYQPFMAEWVNEKVNNFKNNAARLNETIIQPWVIPFGKEFVGVIADAGNWVNKTVIEPYVVPFVTKSVEYAIKDFAQLNEKVIQPYLVPAWETFNESVYQPYLAPAVDVAVNLATAYTDFVTENIYEPIFAPVVNDINQYLVKPFVDPAVAWFDKTWDEYGEWVHNGLDAVGFIPGLGDIMDGVNGLIYLAEGRYLEASISAAAMIPVLGDLAKAGKLGLKLGAEVVEEAAEKLVKEVIEQGTEQATKEIAENVVQKTATNAVEELSEKATTETVEELAGKVTKETFEGTSEKVVKGATENLVEKVTEEGVETSLEKTTKTVGVKAVEPLSQVVTKKSVNEASKKVTSTALEEVAEKNVKEIAEGTTQRVVKHIIPGQVTKLPADVAENLTDDSARELAQKISNELGGKRVWVSAKTGSVYVSSPPANWIDLVERFKKLDLTKADEVDNMLKEVAELTSRGSGDHVVLGPYGELGDFIQEALDTNGIFWDVGDDLWAALADTRIDMFKANDQFIKVQIERGVKSFDIIRTNVDDVIQKVNDGPSIDWDDLSYTEKEILDLATMPNIPYKLVGNSWIRQIS